MKSPSEILAAQLPLTINMLINIRYLIDHVIVKLVEANRDICRSRRAAHYRPHNSPKCH